MYCESFIPKIIANGVADALSKTIHEITTKPDAPLGAIEVVGDRSREVLHNWSGTVITPELTLLHDSIHQRCLAQPNATAIDAWDGQFTYSEVDELSSKLALHLAQYTPGPGIFIPICFEKSRWTAVAILAVMKTGSPFVLLDPSQPSQRLRDICGIIGASVVIVSEAQVALASTFAKHVVITGDQHREWVGSEPGQLRNTSPDEIMCAIFTSGSTGMPKGVQISHSAFATGVREHSVAMRINRDSRVLQLTSYAFDMSIAEHLTTLLQGGCVCVPSDEERKQSLAQAVSRLRADWVFMTPSMARILDPDSFPSIKRMVLGGEIVSEKELSMWRDKLDLYILYGPTECVVCCAITERVTKGTIGRNLGSTFGCRSWITDPSNHERLLPVGAIGELLLEGPIVARGYLDEPTKTAAVFIAPPSWLKAFDDQPFAVYKTGDLVKYNTDGTLHYISRMDTQVKVRGQRVELGEIEHHIRHCYPRVTDAVVELVVPKDKGFGPLLVAFIFIKTEEPTQSTDILAQPSSEFRFEADAVENSLNEQLPSYMVPTLYLPLQKLPLSTNGKVDRQLLRRHAAMLSQNEVLSYRAPVAIKTAPSNDVQRKLLAAWCEVLNLVPEHVGMDDSFVRLGGDSISAIQVVTHCASQQLHVRISDIFRYKTISLISEHTATSQTLIPIREVKTETAFPLTPIQQMFFDAAPDGVNHFNQSFFLRVNSSINSISLYTAFRQLVSRHHMLRVRFRKSNDGHAVADSWYQLVSSEVDQSFRYKEHQISSLSDSKGIIYTSQKSMNPENGPVFAVDLINTISGGRFLFLVAHHLVVDLVSWRIIIKDIEEFLTRGSISSQLSLPFPTWARMQAEYASKHLDPESVFTDYIPPPNLDYWDVADRSNLVEDGAQKEFTLSEETTRLLVGPANFAYDTQPVELFQAALLHSFMVTFKDRTQPPAIFSEGHGREIWDPSINISDTVGWFTTISGTYIESHDVMDILRQTKDRQRNLRDKGPAYFASRYLNPRGRSALHCDGPLEVIFNFTGHYQQLERPDAPLSAVNDFEHGVPDVAGDSPRFALFDVTATSSCNRLRFSFFYNKHAAATRPVDLWISNYNQSLCELARTLPLLTRSYTLVDFPLMPFTYSMLDEFTSVTLPEYGLSLADIEDAYPCSPIQNGMLISQSKEAFVYRNRFLWKLTSIHSVTAAEFARAWRMVAQKHAILRTCFVASRYQGSYMDQVVLRDLPENVITILPAATAPMQVLESRAATMSPKGSPPYHLTLCPSSTGELFFLLEINHALLDGTSLQTLTRDLSQAYENSLPTSPSLLYSDYIKYIQSLPVDASKDYWKHYLAGSEPCLLTTPHAEDSPRKFQSGYAEIPDVTRLRKLCETHDLTIANIFHLAWSLVLQAYTGSDDVCFGYVATGRDIPLVGVEHALGPFINMLVCRTKFSVDVPLKELLQRTQEDYLLSTKHQHISLADIKCSLNLNGLPLFNSAVSFQRAGMVASATEAPSIRIAPVNGEDPTEVSAKTSLSLTLRLMKNQYDIMLNVWAEERIELVLRYWTDSLTEPAADIILDTVVQAVSEIISKFSQPVGDLDLFGPGSRARVMKQNEHVSPRVDQCAHELIKERNAERPSAPAIHAWDGQFTYGELEAKADELATYLSRHCGVGPGVFVPVYFEKSKWTTVAILAILKAGGAFVLMDPSYPTQRLRCICEDVKASVVVTSVTKASDAAQFGLRIIPIGDKLFGWAADLELPFVPVASTPSDPIYVVFTSGSTGRPKGCVHTHASWCTSAEASRIGLFLDGSSRVLQFTSYAFDISIGDMILTLLAGGCVCKQIVYYSSCALYFLFFGFLIISLLSKRCKGTNTDLGNVGVPSDEQRQSDLVGAINDLQPNWAVLTPSVTRIIDPESVSCIKTLVTGGEPLSPRDIAKWRHHAHLLNLYGPAECAILTTLNRNWTNEKDPNNIGFPLSATCWVADPVNHEKLVPVGIVGELLVESPIVGREYINQPAKTAASFLDFPAWLKKIRPGATGRLYRTGDLVQSLDDGSMRYIGRRDEQVKLRGQRVELGEVEYHLQQNFPGAKNVLAEVIRFAENERRPALMAFIELENNPESECNGISIFGVPDDDFIHAVTRTKSQLDTLLPVYMVPTIFIPLTRLPLTRTGKTDRRSVRQAAADLTREEIGAFMSMSASKSSPANDAERQFQQLFAEIFSLEVDGISREDNWFLLGGDSILAMILIPRAREAGYSIKMVDIFKHPKLASLAAAAVRTDFVPSKIPPFALIGGQANKDTLVQLAAAQCDLQATSIEDIYPTTALQEGLIALAAKRPGHYIATFEYELAQDVDIDSFVAAWDTTAAANAILRTRIIQSESLGFFQVVVRHSVTWQTWEDQQTYETHVESLKMSLGDQLVHFGLAQQRESPRSRAKFFLTFHHALYDGGSLLRLWSQVQSAYNGMSLSPQPFNRFIQYTLTTEGADDFWRSEFEGHNAAVFPTLPSAQYIPEPNSSLLYTMSAVTHQSAHYTTSTAIQLAWAIVMSCYTDSTDVLYGLTVNGRSAPVEGIEDITGPTFATFPMRIQVHKDHTVHEALASIQEKTVSMIPFQHYGMQYIRKLSRDAAAACNFQCHMAIQAPASIASNQLLTDVRTKHEDYGAFANYALVIVCHLPTQGQSDVIVCVNYDKNIVDPLEANRMVRQLEHVLRQIELLQSKPESKSIQLRNLDIVSPEDRQQLASWNQVLPPSEDSCLHDLVLYHAVSRPDAPAISAWDGKMTFKDLDSASAILSQQLQALGVQPGSLVPILLDRSKWVVVSMIALHRIGAGCVNIDPVHPKERIKHMLECTGAKFFLCSPGYSESMVFDNIMLITVPVRGQQPRAEDLRTPQVTPRDVAFVIFTSGSTGRPKGILMEHANLVSSIRGFTTEAHLDQNVRGLHFSSYTFDGCIYEIFGVLVNGGCICIPSEYNRMNNVASFINKHEVNWAIFTPSYTTLLEPNSIPTMRTMCMGGEAVTHDNVHTWAAKVNLVNLYGPAEATVCVCCLIPPSGWRPGTIGRVVGGVGWVVMPSDRSRLAPIGTPGELVIEGAVVTRGYIGDPEKTAASYSTSPSWLRPFRQGYPNSRVYYSGDLVRYNADGTICYLGRVDTQVKLRGQRIELGEVEHHVRNAFPHVIDVMAEMVRPNGGAPMLVAFVANAASSTGRTTDKLFHPPSEEFLAQAEAATRKLSSVVPSYMVPTLFIPLSEIPRAPSGKADRRLLREEGAKMSQEEVQAFAGSRATKRQPNTEQEKTLLSLWSQTFKVSHGNIGADDNFLHLGDSIAAIRLSGIARRHGLLLPVSQIFQYPVLSEQARVMTALGSTDLTEEYCPGLLLGIDSIGTFFDRHLAINVRAYRAGDVEDILPTTEMQSSLLRGKNVTYSRLYMNTEVDPLCLEAACDALVRKHAILRTVFVPHHGDILQVVLRDPAFALKQVLCDGELWEFSEKWCTQDAAALVPFGALHFQPVLISRSKSDHLFMLRMTHAQYDGGSFPLISSDLTSAYSGNQLQSAAPSFAYFLRYRLSQNSSDARKFWREYLSGSQMTSIEMLGRPPQNNAQAEFIVKPLRKMPLPTLPSGITMASMVKAAWSVVLSRATRMDDVVFGHVINGRDAPLTGVDQISGPCITIAPFRVSMQKGWNVLDLLNHTQRQYARSMSYSNMEFKSILRKATSWPPDTEFGSVLTHQDAHIDLSGSVNHAAASQWRNLDFGYYSNFHVVTYPVGAELWVQFGVSSHKMHPSDADHLMNQFCGLMAQFAEDASQPLAPSLGGTSDA
ncbi:hypothetical protein RRF57_000692 [Xylaria bambusicola]|uniref:Carrier domain-containing protein n=1 Tax=Xylaria bambusicola TaxID=326684 RepID=A0AAN7UG58_9PEZI